MTPRQKKLVKASFDKILPISDCVARLFYIRLFELDSELKQLFAGDMDKQGRELMRFIAGVIDTLDDFESALPEIEKLGKRHVKYGVKNHHYDTVCLALLWSLEQGLDTDFTTEVKVAWNVMYGLISGAMKAAAAEMAA